MKKILNIFASISLVITGASNVVACGFSQNSSPPKPSPNPKSEIQKLYSKLNNQKFTIDKDNNFWGNEANYQNDLLTDLEKVSNITSQEDKNLLSLNSDLKTLDQPGNYTFLIGIGTGELEKTALVTIDWELTASQSIPGIFTFYTKTWPKDFQNYEQIYDVTQITKLFLSVWDKTTKNWPKDLKRTIAWSEFTHDLLNQVFFEKESYFLIPLELQKYFHIQSDVSIDLLNVNQYKQVKNPFYLQKSANDPKIFLPYYDYSQYTPFSPQKGLPKANQNWTVGYDTDYNLLKNKLKNYTISKKSKKPIPIRLPLSGFTKDTSGPYKGKYYVDDKTDYSNEQLIIEYLDDHGFQQLDPGLTLEGQFIPGQASPLEVYYNGVDQKFPIYVYIS